MKLGQKIKAARIRRKMTQAALAGNVITRNMLSAIENGKANPSLETVQYLANKLEIPLSFFLSDNNDLFFYEKNEMINAIKSSLESKNFNACISLCMKLDGIDDEIAFILAKCYYELTYSCVMGGSLKSAKRHFESCMKYCQMTLYDTTRFETMLVLLNPLISNVNSPLLEFNNDEFLNQFQKAIDYEFYKYLTQDSDYSYTNFAYSYHLKAKALIKERKYQDAIKLLVEIETNKNTISKNAYLMFNVYTDLDYCYKQLFDFENAYRYSTKRISLMEGFNA